MSKFLPWILAGLALVALGWFGHGWANGPAPDVARLLREADSAAGIHARAREDSIRQAHGHRLAADSARTDSLLRTERAKARSAWVAVGNATTATDSALAAAAAAGATVEGVRQALALERAARDSARVADSTAAATELEGEKRRAALVVTERDRLYGRVDSLTNTVTALRDGLKRASKKGLDPAVTLSYGVGCNNLAIGGSVRVLGWLRGGVHVETKACS